MDPFSTLGECDFGAIWFVEAEGKVVVNAYQGAMYFDVDGFMHFARMVETARKRLSGERESAPAPSAKPVSKIREFRRHDKD